MTLRALVDCFVVAMPILYVVLVGLYAASFFGNVPAADRWKTRFLLVTVIAHLTYISLRTVTFDHPPITTVFEIMTMLAACMAIAYTYIELQTKATNTGFFILILALLFQTVSSLFIKDLTEIAPVLRSRLLGFHVTSALLGYTAISLSAVFGLLYLMLYHDIKSSQFGLVYKRLPNLEMLEAMSLKAELFGFVMLTIAISVGMFWLPRAFENFTYLDPKLVGTFGIWIMYAVGLAAKRRFNWHGRKLMVISVVAFGIVFLSMTVINLFLSGFHTFR